MTKPPLAFAPRPDLVDSFVHLWLSGAVAMAHAMTAPFDALRQPIAESETPEKRTVFADGTIPEDVDALTGPSTVSPIRPEDLVAPEGCTETCADCRFYRAANAQAGECRRFAPGVYEDSDLAFWPITAGKDWCGEFFPALTALAPRH